MKRPQLIRLHDILEAIDGVAEMMEGVDVDSYRCDFKLRKAVERCIEIVSEATRRPDHVEDRHALAAGFAQGHRLHDQGGRTVSESLV